MAPRAHLLLAALASGLALLAAKPHPLTVDDLWAAQRVGTPSLSPDGRWAVVEVTTPDLKENESPFDLWLLATDGAARRQLTAHKARDSGPLWSPDGQWIAFTSKREGDEQAQAYVISPAGGEARRLTKLATGETRDLMAGWTNGVRALEPSAGLYDLASDEQELAFVADLGADPGRSPNTDLVLWSLTDGTRQNLTADNPAHDSNRRYLPDGRSLAWLRRVKPRVAIWDRVAKAQRVLTEAWDRSPNGLT